MQSINIKGLLVFLLLLPFCLEAQVVHRFANPSFEGEPGLNNTPEGWKQCSMVRNIPATVSEEIISNSNGFYICGPDPSDGRTYMLMVGRQDDSWEAVYQKMEQKLEKGKWYAFEVDVARAHCLVSTIVGQGGIYDFSAPLSLGVKGSNHSCKFADLLYKSPAITDTLWQRIEIAFKAKKNYTNLVLEVTYPSEAFIPYNGNLLLDNISDLREIAPPQQLIKQQPENLDLQDASPSFLLTHISESAVFDIEYIYADAFDKRALYHARKVFFMQTQIEQYGLLHFVSQLDEAKVNNLKESLEEVGALLEAEAIWRMEQLIRLSEGETLNQVEWYQLMQLNKRYLVGERLEDRLLHYVEKHNGVLVNQLTNSE
ncbi:MAG: hypothetical protein GYB31_08705 [Bacteroidetes bacterium]|nr:hypothetical protein [Bacteroidota bacterium]